MFDNSFCASIYHIIYMVFNVRIPGDVWFMCNDIKEKMRIVYLEENSDRNSCRYSVVTKW